MFGGAPVFDGGAVTSGAAGNGSPVVGTCCASSTLGTTRKAALQTTRKAALQTTCFKNCMTMDQNPSGWPGLFENLPFARQCLPRWPLPSIAEELCAYPRTTAGPLRLCRRGNMRPNAGTGFLRIPLFVNGCIGNAGNYIYEDKAKKFKFRVQSGPLLIIAQPAFRGVGATSSSISAPATPCRVGGYYRRTGRTPDPAAVSPARSPNAAGARNSVNNDTTQG